MKIPVLTYHSLHTPGNEYHNNDHVALEADLKLLKRMGYVPHRLSSLVDRFNHGRLDELSGHRVCAITFDDGVTHDYIDFFHPARGLLKSFATLLGEAAAPMRGWRTPTATSFVIGSPEARDILDRTCIAGRDQWHDRWWLSAAESGTLDIGNHSWDHCHPNVPEVAQREQKKGNFFVIDSWEDAERQILDAEQHITSIIGDYSTRIFAYPYGHVNRFLREEFFPHYSDRFRAAFATGGDYMTETSNRWAIPRFVCGEHWKTPEELEQILNGTRVSMPFFRRRASQLRTLRRKLTPGTS